MVRDAESQVNSLPIDEVRTDSKVWNDASALAKELEEKGIAIKAYVEGTSSGALGHTQLYVATDGMTRDEFKQAIEQTTGTGDVEKQIAEVSRFIVGKVVLKTSDGINTPKVKSVQFRALARPELVVAQIPINVSDRVERPNRKPIKVKGLGEAIYSELRTKEGASVTLEIFDPAEVIRGVVERISYPINSNVERGSVTQYAIITVRGTRQQTVTDVTSTEVFGIQQLGLLKFGA